MEFFIKCILDDDKVVVTGWGKTANAQSNEVRAFSKILRRIQLPIANHLCTQPPFEIDESIQICAGGVKSKNFLVISPCQKSALYLKDSHFV